MTEISFAEILFVCFENDEMLLHTYSYVFPLDYHLSDVLAQHSQPEWYCVDSLK